MTVVRQRVIEIERQGSSKHKPYGCISMSATRHERTEGSNEAKTTNK